MRRGTAALGLLIILLAPSAYGREATPAEAPPAPTLLVKFRDEGAYALEACAEELVRSGRSFRNATRDRSDSLDRLNRRLGVRRARALFRQADGTPLPDQRRKLRARLAKRPGRLGRVARSTDSEAKLPDLTHVYRIELSAETNAEEAAALFAGDPHVAWVQRDHTHELDWLPNDPYLHSSGSWGQSFGDLWALDRIQAPQAWEISRGEGVIVAVVDTGIDYHHPDIADNVWVNPGEDLNGDGRVQESEWNGIDDDDNGFVDDLRGFDFAGSRDTNEDGDYSDPDDLSDPDPFDDRGHGTHVAGTIAAVADNGIGIVGVAPGATVMAVKGFPRAGPGRDSDLWRGVLYAAANGAEVINTSWSCHPVCPENPLGEEVVRLVHAMGAVIVTSAGNKLADVVFNSPENMRETITVASSGFDDQRSASFSNFGWLLDLAAPGGDNSDESGVYLTRRNILSLRSSADEAAEPFAVDDTYLRNAGTSMAAPHVSGVVALLRSHRPDLGYEEIRRILRLGADDLGPPGHDRALGAGRLNALSSLASPPLPEMSAAITAPRQGSTFRPGEVVEIRGSASGDDLASFTIRYGIGGDPQNWHLIGPERDDPIRDGVLAHLGGEGFEEGTYTIRLDARSNGGTVYSEFLVLSFEANEFRLLSEPGRPVARPDVSDSLVVWQSRRDPEDPELETNDENLFATHLETGRHFVVSSAPGDQAFASISGRTISWLDDRNELSAPEVFGCRFDPRRGQCAEFGVSNGATTPLPPANARSRIYWLDRSSGERDVRGCRPDPRGGTCNRFETGLPEVRRSFLQSDGRGLVWVEPGSQLALCAVDRRGRCEDESLADAVLAYSRPTSSGDLLAWVGFEFSGRNPLLICEVEADSGACSPIEVATEIFDSSPKLSGNRLVWDAAVGDELGDVFFCEFDAVLLECPVQRLTAQLAQQGGSDIDGRQVVFEDDRDGATHIWGIRLPALAKLRHRRTREGRMLRVPLRVAGPAGERDALVLAVEPAGDASLSQLGARFVQLDADRAELLWRPAPGQAGSYAFTFSGTTGAGLVTRQTIRVEVTPLAREGIPLGLRRFWRWIANRTARSK
jgi:subtilisin family serine protease